MIRRPASQVQVINELDEPYLLVRAESLREACDRAETWLAREGEDSPWGDTVCDGFRLAVATVRDGWWRWVPVRPGHGYSDYDRLLHPAEPLSRGAFRAWEIGICGVAGPAGETESQEPAPVLAGQTDLLELLGGAA